MELITENPQITVPKISEIIGLSISGVEKNIRRLKQEGIISRTSKTKSGDDKSIFEFTDNTMYVQLPSERGVAESETQSKGKVRGESKGKVRGKSKGKILELITENPQITVPEISETIGLSIAGVEKNIRQLKQEGIISRTSETKSGEWIIN